MTTQIPVRIPTSNKKIFLISFIVSIVAIFLFVYFIKYSALNHRIGVDKEVFAKKPNPTKVFDVPLTEVKLTYIDLEKYADGAAGTSDTASSTHPDKIGCGDALATYTIPVGEEVGIDPVDRVNFILPKLLDQTLFTQFKESDQAKQVNPYSVFANGSVSKLTLKSIHVQTEDVTVKLDGALALGGTCDSPRAYAQLTSTIGQFFPDKSISIFINDVALEKVLSDK
jgi:hypothetical protein